MSIPFSTNTKLADWIPSEQQIQTITAAREFWDLVPEEEGEETNESCINFLNVYSHLHPEITDPQQFVDDTFEFITQTLLLFQTQGRELMARQTTAPRLLRLPEVLNLVGVTRSTLYRWIEAGTFLRQISVGGNTVVWLESVVTKWMQDQIAKQ